MYTEEVLKQIKVALSYNNDAIANRHLEQYTFFLAENPYYKNKVLNVTDVCNVIGKLPIQVEKLPYELDECCQELVQILDTIGSDVFTYLNYTDLGLCKSVKQHLENLK